MSSTRGTLPTFLVNEKFDRTNWITWSENILISTHMRGAYNNLTSTIKKPVFTFTTSTIITKPTTILTEKETASPASIPVTLAPTKIETRWESCSDLAQMT